MKEGAGLGDQVGPVPQAKAMMTTQDRIVRVNYKERVNIIKENARRALRAQHPFQPFYEVMPDGAWAGERCFIIGGGPSLEGFDFERLRGQGRVIAINRAYEVAPFADILYFMDNGFYQWVHNGTLSPGCLEAWKSFEGHKVFLNIIGREYADVYSIKSLGRVGLSNSLKQGIYHGNNSGVGAVGLAVILKANPIYLLGIDCKIDDEKKKSHFHSGYSKRPLSPSAYRSFRGDFERLFRFIQRTKYRVINLNPASSVRCFPISTIDEVLANGKSPRVEYPPDAEMVASGWRVNNPAMIQKLGTTNTPIYDPILRGDPAPGAE